MIISLRPPPFRMDITRKRIWSPLATPRLRCCEHSSHRKIALQIAAGNLHLHAIRSGSSPSIKAMKKAQIEIRAFFMVRMRGFEPPRLAALVSETSASTISPHPHVLGLITSISYLFPAFISSLTHVIVFML